MLGFVSRFGSAKGMVVVPNFFGVTTATAQSQIVSAGLKVSLISGIRNTNVLAENGVSLSQLPVAGTLVDYETEVVITSGNYVADSVTVGPCQGYTIPTNDSDFCSGTLYVYGATRTKNRKTVTTTNNVTGTSTITYDYSCEDTVVPRGSEYINGQCGYSTPVASCTPTQTITETTCNAAYSIGSSGTFTRTTSGTDSACNPYSSSVSVTCYQAVCGSYGSWTTISTDTKRERRTRTCQRTDGTTYLDSETRCRTTYSTTYGTCNNRTGKKSFTTTATNLCTGAKTSTTGTMPCNAI